MLRKARALLTPEPLGYLDFLKLLCESALVLTDSGGIQEETTVLGVPCITVRENTERPVTVTNGTNHLVGTRKSEIIKAAVSAIQEGSHRRVEKRIPPLWDGKAAQRIVSELVRLTA